MSLFFVNHSLVIIVYTFSAMTIFSDWSQKRQIKIGIITKFIDGDLSRSQTAELAGISKRQVTRSGIVDYDNTVDVNPYLNRLAYKDSIRL